MKQLAWSGSPSNLTRRGPCLSGMAVIPPLSLSSLKVIPQNGPSQPTTWSHLATEARALARRLDPKSQEPAEVLPTQS